MNNRYPYPLSGPNRRRNVGTVDVVSLIQAAVESLGEIAYEYRSTVVRSPDPKDYNAFEWRVLLDRRVCIRGLMEIEPETGQLPEFNRVQGMIAEMLRIPVPRGTTTLIGG